MEGLKLKDHQKPNPTLYTLDAVVAISVISEWQVGLKYRPDVKNLIKSGQISKSCSAFCTYLRCMHGWEIDQEIAFPNINDQLNPYLFDFYIADLEMFVEFDGLSYHTKSSSKRVAARKEERLHRLNQFLGTNSRFVRIPYQTPENLLYSSLTGLDRLRIETEYKQWFNDEFCPWAETIIFKELRTQYDITCESSYTIKY